MGLTINVGRKYEGRSNNFFIEDGVYVLQIVDIEVNKEGAVNMTLVTSQNQRVYKRFYTIAKDGTSNVKALRELADFVTTAMQIEDEESSVDVEDALGYYVECTLKNGFYESAESGKKATVYCNKPQRADGFPNDAPSLLDKYQKGKKKSKNAEKAKAVRAQVEEVEEEVDVDDVIDVDAWLNGDD